MRKHGRVDGNQAPIVAALRKIGASVQVLSSIGGGCPDILVGFRENNYVFEIKDPSKPKSDRKLTPDEEKWHATWQGLCYVVETIDEIFAIMHV